MPALTLTGRHMPTPTPICPQCHSKNVKVGSIWNLGPPPLYVTEPPTPIFACQEVSCLYQWARLPDGEVTRLQTKWKTQGNPACAHPNQRLIDLSLGDTGPVMALYYCADCGKESVRPIEASD
jgi:hypothetical protein